ncbi:lamin tail domain-containing protein [Marinilabilia sp.]|uniref:lamin tail domain-containing protein n=1 Tax=Marinilabilia sp. TaxID=2021252 RepID=UPI0025BF58C7|nr:lamin tail domain-containing protein [Marinilabilia sp.]
MNPIFFRFFAAFLFVLPMQQGIATSFEFFPEPWLGDAAWFIYHQEDNLIQLNAPEESGEAFLWHSSSAFEDAVWETGFRMEFNPSSSNYLQIVLVADDPETFQNGFYLVAGTSDDNISLWERESGRDQLLIEGAEDCLNSSPAVARVKVTRRKGGHWKLETDTGDGWKTEGSTTYKRGFSSEYAGFNCHYTKTRRDKFFLEPIEISGEAYKDTVPPRIESMQIKNGHTLELIFSEPVDESASSPLISIPDFGGDFILNTQYDATFRNAVIYLKQKLPDVQNEDLIFSGWCDQNGACLEDTALYFSYLSPEVLEVNTLNYTTIELIFNQQIPEEVMIPERFTTNDADGGTSEIEKLSDEKYLLHLKRKIPDAKEIFLSINNLILPNGDTIPSGPYSIYYHEAAFSDLVFTEIMHDPSPPALLPESEYIELFNRSDLPVNLKKMTLQINRVIFELPEYVLFPGRYIVLTATETDFPEALTPYKWIALTNSGGEIVLRNPSGQITTAFRYPELLPGPQFKQDGGWSLECIDSGNLSCALSNWAYCSNKRGGTPGMENSVKTSNPDTQGPGLMDAWLNNDSVLMLNFGEPLSASTIKAEELGFSPPDVKIEALSKDSVFGDVLTVVFQESLIPNEVINLSVPSGFSDLAGNPFKGPSTLSFGLPGRTDSLDVIINELLFDPPIDGCDYVELYNHSDKILALDSLCLARGGEEGIPESLVPLSDKCRWFLPGTYLCFANDADWVKEYFKLPDTSNLISLPRLPNYVTEGGIVFVARKNGTIIEQMNYSPSHHFSLLADTKGVALERTQFDAPSKNPMTWHSAASTAGYGTPGSINSQQIKAKKEKPEKLFSVSPEIFTPDLDGNDDQLIISYLFDKPGKKGTFTVYDAEGFQVKELVNNQSLGTSGIITWDGTNDDHAKVPPGIYIIGARVFGEDGIVRNGKETCVLGIRQN